MKKISFVILIVVLSFCWSCSNADDIKPEIKNMDLQIEFVRFDSIFAQTEPQNLEKVKSDYPFMFKNNIPDSLWKLKMTDTLQAEIEAEVGKKFSDFSKYRDNISLFFKHLKYYFPEEEIPQVVTLAEFVDYKSKVILDDSVIFISLDNYLGQDHRFYQGFQDYISALQAPHQILPNIAEQYAEKLINRTERRDFLSTMIHEGKKLYFKEQMLPKVKKYDLLGYTEEEYQWSETYETMVWQYFVERDMLYSSQSDLRRRFLSPGPFTKFYLEIDNETPPRLGQYIGWQIVKAYANRYPGKSLVEILNTDEQNLFSQSKYKP